MRVVLEGMEFLMMYWGLILIGLICVSYVVYELVEDYKAHAKMTFIRNARLRKAGQTDRFEYR